MQLLDTHQHLILPELCYGWTDDLPELAHKYFTPADYVALTEGKDIAASIFMETGVDEAFYQKEARVIAALMGQNGMIGQIASCRPERDEGFEAWLEECGDLKVLGFRRILHVVDDGLSQSQTFRRNVKAIGKQGLTFDLCFLARQLPLAVALLKACPDQLFVLDHCGVPDIAGGAFVPWADELQRVAALPNVILKLSGITAYCGAGSPPTCHTLQRWFDHVLHCFGPARMVWGSDWPVVNLGAGLPAWIDMTRALLASLSADEQNMIACGNARRYYLKQEDKV